MSNDLEWLLIRKYNSFIVKKVPEGPIFSKEPGNLTNVHSYKYSGLANSKAIDVSDSPNGIKITTRKVKAAPSKVASARSTTTIRPRSGPRRALGIAASPAKRGYRPDLRPAVLARTSALLAAQKEPKPSPPKKTRGKKKAVAETA
ncbi:ribosomal L28e/Mak16 [Schizophyllum commune]|nr:ribosomal protein L28e [Schizophyllum commune Loenen D]KAI5828406.1 ribosomal protein L28e [Schizophyllum commune Tattone D]